MHKSKSRDKNLKQRVKRSILLLKNIFHSALVSLSFLRILQILIYFQSSTQERNYWLHSCVFHTQFHVKMVYSLKLIRL